jgi:hypothetical protein
MTTNDKDHVSLERLERALAVIAYIVSKYGHAYADNFTRLEKEVARARQDDPVVRARRLLETYTDNGGRKAIALSTSNLLSSE